MNPSKRVLFSTCVIFTFIFLVHMLVWISGWAVQIENFTVPKYTFLFTTMFSGFLSYNYFCYWHKK